MTSKKGKEWKNRSSISQERTDTCLEEREKETSNVLGNAFPPLAYDTPAADLQIVPVIAIKHTRASSSALASRSESQINSTISRFNSLKLGFRRFRNFPTLMLARCERTVLCKRQIRKPVSACFLIMRPWIPEPSPRTFALYSLHWGLEPLTIALVRIQDRCNKNLTEYDKIKKSFPLPNFHDSRRNTR